MAAGRRRRARGISRWVRQDSNLRSPKAPDLQSGAIAAPPHTPNKSAVGSGRSAVEGYFFSSLPTADCRLPTADFSLTPRAGVEPAPTPRQSAVLPLHQRGRRHYIRSTHRASAGIEPWPRHSQCRVLPLHQTRHNNRTAEEEGLEPSLPNRAITFSKRARRTDSRLSSNR